MTAIVCLCLLLLAGWAIVSIVLGILILPIPAATAEERRLGWQVVLGWPIVLIYVVCSSTAADWRTR